MKKILALFIFLSIFPSIVVAEDNDSQQQVNDNRATIAVQKQPTLENNHKQIAKQNKWCIIIQVNGKIKYIDGQDRQEK